MENNKRVVTKDDINIAWENRMEKSHCTPIMRKKYMKRNKYYRMKLHVKRLINLLEFGFGL